MFFKRILWFIAVALLVTALASVAQVTALSIIRGTVADQSGAILPGAEITLFDRATNTIARTPAYAQLSRKTRDQAGPVHSRHSPCHRYGLGGMEGPFDSPLQETQALAV